MRLFGSRKKRYFALAPLCAVLAVLLCLSSGVVFGTAGPGDTAPGEAMTAEDCYAAVRESLVYIRAYNASELLKATGSGFLITEDGTALTAAHVVNGAARVTAITPDGSELPAEVTYCDLPSDVAVLRLPEGSYPALALSEAAPVGGQALWAMGYPAKGTCIITEGLVAAPLGEISGKERMLVTCSLVNGMSGGPILNRYGQVVGMASGSVRTMDGIHLSALYGEIVSAVSGETPAE